MTLVAIQTIINVPEGTRPNFPYHNSMARHIKAAQAELAALAAGSEPGFAASLDLRWFAEDVGAADAVEIVPTQEPESGDDLVSGMFYDVLLAATNTGAGVTLEVRNNADDVSITKNVKKWNGDDLVAGDLQAGRIERFQYVSNGAIDEWRVFLLRDLINPMTTAGDIILATTGGAPQRLAKGTTGRHMRAGSSGPEYGGDVDMAGAILRGQGLPIVTLAANTNLNNGTHRAAMLEFTTDSTLTIKPNGTTAYSASHQCVVTAIHADGCTVAADAGVSLNGVDGGSATINQYETYPLYRRSADTWVLSNASVS